MRGLGEIGSGRWVPPRLGEAKTRRLEADEWGHGEHPGVREGAIGGCAGWGSLVGAGFRVRWVGAVVIHFEWA